MREREDNGFWTEIYIFPEYNLLLISFQILATVTLK